MVERPQLRPVRVGRFAPSPTGAMHLGNARTALLAWLHTRAAGGRHILRFEDLDTGRVRGWAYDVTRRDLEWLGLDWDAEYTQSERLDLYADALARLGTYPCTCTRRAVREALKAAGGAPHGAEAVYPGTCRPNVERPHDARASALADASANAGKKPVALRWRVPAWRVCVRDEWQRSGTGQRLSLCQSLRGEVGDIPLRRSDGVYAYHLAVVVDDADMGVTDVLRGVDLWPAAPRQVALQRALDLPTPRYWHVPLMTDYKGERLAKRGGAPSVQQLRESGAHSGHVLANLCQSLGWRVGEEVSAEEVLALWLAGEVGVGHPTPPLSH